eukprot:CAMPEP_0115020620 /NCGR_PEP_ID=MMETSP0216-20121206/30287_1 /TAXON_ID=223996 /ORGANISM="Protocruzia adherens, Strain Boccale" /LENGTH=203 /DNA_ID=CAMNT_0002392595 /DNA_START=493 /DNA_END=1104 /DNA_ORIENTATION=-
MDVKDTDNSQNAPSRVKIDVELSFGQDEKELVQDVEASTVTGGDLLLSDVVATLKQIGYPLEGAMISYFSEQEKFLVHCGSDPLDSSAVMARNEYEARRRIALKFRPGMKPYTSQGSSSSVTGANPTGPTQGTGAPANQKQAPNRRTKERKIGFIIEKVALWRKLYNGIKGADGELVRYSLEDAAHRVGISKKSLDDYLLQLR